MLCLLVQPQKELQLDLKTNNTQNHQKIELYGSPTTKDLEVIFIQMGRRGRNAEMGREAQRCSVTQRGGGSGKEVPHSRVVDKNQEVYLGGEQSQPQARLHSPGFQCQEDKFR